MSKIIEALPPPPLYYHAQDTSYWRRDESGRWIRVNDTSAKCFVVEYGYHGTATETGANSESSRCLMKIQSTRNVAYIGPLAGYPTGVYSMNGRHVLVTESPSFIEAQSGEWPTLKRLFDGLFIHDDVDQLPYFYGWLQSAMESFRLRRWKSSQLLALAGPVSCGKSLTQNLITTMFGSRSSQPYSFMMGRTDFNSHLFRGEHLMLEDEAENSRYENRRHFAANIKKLLCNRDQYVHGKNKEAATLQPIWRMSLSLNDDPEALQVLPPFDSDVHDKIIALRVKPAANELKSSLGMDEDQFWKLLVNELPAFLHYVEHEFEVPAELRDVRYGIRAFQHPDLVEKIQETAPQMKLIELVDAELFRHERNLGGWEGTASQLAQALTQENRDSSYEARKLLSGTNTVGRYLARLKESDAEHVAGRVTSRKLHGNTRWHIAPPTWLVTPQAPAAPVPVTTASPVQLPKPPASLVG